MKNKNIIPLIALLFVGSFVSADELTGSTGGTLPPPPVLSGGTHSGIKQELKKNYLAIRGNWVAFHEDFGSVNKYLKRPLTGADLSGAKAIIKEKNAAIKAINQEIKTAITGSGTIDWTGLVTKYESIYRSFATAITPYIAPTKLDAFNKFVEAKIATVKKNLQLRQKNITLKEQKHEKAEKLKEQQATAKAKKSAESKSKKGGK